MDFEETVNDIVNKFVNEIRSKVLSEDAIQKCTRDFKMKLLCIYAASQNTYDIITSLDELPLCLEAKN